MGGRCLFEGLTTWVRCDGYDLRLMNDEGGTALMAKFEDWAAYSWKGAPRTFCFPILYHLRFWYTLWRTSASSRQS